MFKKKSESTVIAAVTIGSILEWYEVFLYIYWAPILSASLFDYSSELVDLISSLIVFAIGFLSRPAGGLLFGYIGDRCGRKEALVITIILSSLPSIVIAFLPSYTVWSYMSQISLLILRFLQGVPAGGELPGAICYLFESSPPERRRYMTSYAFVGAQIGGIISMLECFLLEKLLPRHMLIEWGWRASFLIGGLLGLFGFFLRRQLEESHVFKDLIEKHETLRRPIHESFHRYGKRMLIGFCISIFEVVGFFMIAVFPALYFEKIFKITNTQSLLITAAMLILSVVTIPLFGKYGDKHKNKPLLILSGIGVILFSYPFYLALNSGSLIYTLLLEIVFIFFLNIQFALLPHLLSRLFPIAVRFTCLGFSFNVCDSLIGGISPILAIYLVQSTGTPGSFLILFVLSALVFLITLQFIRKKRMLL